MEDKNKVILDACCSVRAMWFNKKHPKAIYMDIRKEPAGFLGYGRKEELNPDIIGDFRDMDFKNKSFKLVVFEPPHISSFSKTSLFGKKFGILDKDNWKSDIKKGFDECWRVLDDYGVLEFKWSSSEIPFKEVLELAPCEPLFGNRTNYKATSETKWFCFMKFPEGEK